MMHAPLIANNSMVYQCICVCKAVARCICIESSGFLGEPHVNLFHMCSSYKVKCQPTCIVFGYD